MALKMASRIFVRGKKNKDKAFNKDGSEGNLPRIPHLQDDRIGKVGMPPCLELGQRVVGKDGHEEGPQGRGKGGRCH